MLLENNVIGKNIEILLTWPPIPYQEQPQLAILEREA
jgi:hypothetical protein